MLPAIFCVIDKSFSTHLKEVNSYKIKMLDVGVIDISARNFIIQHNLKNNCFGEYR